MVEESVVTRLGELSVKYHCCDITKGWFLVERVLAHALWSVEQAKQPCLLILWANQSCGNKKTDCLNLCKMGNTLIRLLSRLDTSFQLTANSLNSASYECFLCVDSQKIKCYEDYGQWHWGDATLSPTIAQSSAAVTSKRKTLTWQDRPLVWGREWSHRCLYFPNVPPPVRAYVTVCFYHAGTFLRG